MRPSADQQRTWMEASSLFHVSTYMATYPECMSCVGPWKLINNNSSFSEGPLLCTARHCTWDSATSISSSILRKLKEALGEGSNQIGLKNKQNPSKKTKNPKKKTQHHTHKKQPHTKPFLLPYKKPQQKEKRKNMFSLTKSTNLR